MARATSELTVEGDDGADVSVPGEDCEQAPAPNVSRISRMAVDLGAIALGRAIGLP